MGHMMSHEKSWGEPYVRTFHGEGTRVFMVHMWPMILLGWFVFMLGVMTGAKKSMAMQAMGGPGGMGMGMGEGHGMGGKMMGRCGPGMMMGMGHKRAMMMHHHHGYGGGPCCEQHGEGEQQGEKQQEPVGTM